MPLLPHFSSNNSSPRVPVVHVACCSPFIGASTPTTILPTHNMPLLAMLSVVGPGGGRRGPHLGVVGFETLVDGLRHVGEWEALHDVIEDGLPLALG